MSDLLGGPAPSAARGTNGNARTTATATGGQQPAKIKPPTEIMREREVRQRARAQRQQAEEQRAEFQHPTRAHDDELRQTATRRSDNMAAHLRDSGYRSAGVSAGGVTPGDQAYATPTVQQQVSAGATPRAGQGTRYPPQATTGSYEYPPPMSQSMPQQQQNYPASARIRTTNPQDDVKLAPASHPTAMTTMYSTTSAQPQQPIQSRPTAATGPTPISQREPQSTRHAPQQVIAAPTGEATGRQAGNSNVSSFPHAFERWETLSSRWEGLTSYWIRKLETNPTKVDINQEMARQITDLAAAGANLFHAVVELQRLRASSERKFQRWYFKIREDEEKAQENEARLKRELAQETARRVQAERAAAAMPPPDQKNNYERLLGEYRRELQISKDEARRAWEDLGRQEQMERDREQKLRAGNPVEIGGIQVLPHSAPSRGGSLQQRSAPQTATQASSYASPRSQQEYASQYDPQGSSPTNTDPFSTGERQAIIHPPPGDDGRSYPQQPSIPTRATSRPQDSPAIPPTAPQPPQTSAPRARAPATAATGLPHGASPSERFYSQQPSGTSQPPTGMGSTYPTSTTPHQVISGSETEEEPDYELDASGHVRVDSAGQPIVARDTRTRPRHIRRESEDSDEFDLARERRHARQPHAQVTAGQSYGTVPSSTAGYATQGGAAYAVPRQAEIVSGGRDDPAYRRAMLSQYEGAEEEERVDYEGAGFGEDDTDWAELQSRHHHPTRLSDVPEEDERSRGSLRSAGPSAGTSAGGAGGGNF